jgi:hypothetical protein
MIKISNKKIKMPHKNIPARNCEYKSVEITKRCNLVIEFIIPMLIEGSKCFERHTAHHQEL